MLKTKLNKPISTSKLIFRKELLDKLENVKGKKLALVSAPAGYGKSTLIGQWIDQYSLKYSWYSLDKSDNDIVTFLKYTISGIQLSFSNFGLEAMRLLESNSKPSYETIATYLINDFYEIKERFILVFDDYHLIENKDINNLIYFLLGNLPVHVQVVLITRSDPSIRLARLRSQQLITDIRLADLCFTANNIYDLFMKGLNLDLTIEDAKNLEAKTEGWIAGLQLTALSLQGKANIGDFVRSMKSDNRYIVDYLIEEVLQQQSQEFRDFLLCTSILDQFNSPLCNFMLDISNSQDIIENLEKNNMFIIPLDNERNWFRYHHLFANLLQHRLSVKLKDKIPELHIRASEWFENNGQLVFALEHSLAAGNKEKALNHFANVIDYLWKTSQYQTTLQFGGMFLLEELVKNAVLCFNYFWILFQSGFIEHAESLINALQSHTSDKTELAKVYVCINNLKVFTGDIESVYTYSELVIQNINEYDDYWNILALLSLGEAHLLRFELIESFKSFDKAAVRASSPQLIYFEMINRTRSSAVLWMLGDFSGSYKLDKNLLDKYTTIAANNSFGIGLLSSILYCKIGNFLIHINQIEDGLQKCRSGYEFAKKTTNTMFIATCTYLLAKAYNLVGEYNKAISLVEELDALHYKKITKYMCVLVDSLKSKLYLATNNQDKLKLLFQMDFKSDKNYAYERIIYNIDKARYQIAEGKILEAIDMLHQIAEELKAQKVYGLLIEVELLQARAYLLIQEEDKAMDILLKTVLRTQNTGLIRMYIIEGPEIETLLKKIKQVASVKTTPQLNKVDIDYINRLLRVFEKEKKVLAVTLNDALSSRELETLKLIAENLTNQEIADALYISITTVKTHVRNILLKLEAKNRNEAAIKAKEKGLLR